MLSFILPTRNRPAHLAHTLAAIDTLRTPAGQPLCAEVIVADNASEPPVSLPSALPCGIPLRVLRRRHNESAAARNAAALASDPASTWLVMLDDDSHPLDAGFLDALDAATPDTAAVAAEITLPTGARESGGLPEVFIGCGVALRRDAFLTLGAPGYDPTFDYYAEEYDLAARFIAAGMRTTFNRRFRVLHHKAGANRHVATIVRRLVRNNGWVAQRYAPPGHRAAAITETIRRYATIARKEHALAGYARGLTELLLTLPRQPRSPLSLDHYARFTGLAHARAALAAAHAECPLGRCALFAPGKNASVVETALAELGVSTLPPSESAAADTLVVATLSPGPMLDALDQAPRRHPGRRVVAPWLVPTNAALTPSLIAAQPTLAA